MAAARWRAPARLLVVLLSILLCAAWAGLARRRASHERVAVVGAGIAGISAAQELRAAGHDVFVLEARPRIGGRIHTSRELPGVVAELGAAFIHRPAGNPVRRLAEAHNATLAAYDYSRCRFHDRSGAAFDDGTREAALAFFRKTIYGDFFEWRDEFPRGWDEPMATTLGNMDFYDALPATERELFDLHCFQHIVQDLQADLDSVSARSYDHSFFFGQGHGENRSGAAAAAGADLFFTSGFDRVLAGMLGSVPLRLEAPVAAVRYADHPDWAYNAVELAEDLAAEAVWRATGVGAGDAVAAADAAASAAADPSSSVQQQAQEEEEEEEEDVDAAVEAPPRPKRNRVVRWVGWFVYEVLTLLEEVWVLATHWAVLRPGAGAAEAYGGVGVQLSLASGGEVVYADKAVLTLPIGCLKKKRVSFEPPLGPDLLNVIADLGVSSTMKVCLCWQDADVFWGEGFTYFHKYPKDGKGRFGRGKFLEVVNLKDLAGVGCLLVEVETGFAKELSGLSKEAVVARVMEDISLVFPGAVAPTKGASVSDFARSPYSDGGYVHWPPDTTVEDGEEFLYDVSRRLYWAGEHTIWQYYGNTHGAHLSGLRAAHQIAWAYKKTLLVLATVTVLHCAAVLLFFC